MLRPSLLLFRGKKHLGRRKEWKPLAWKAHARESSPPVVSEREQKIAALADGVFSKGARHVGMSCNIAHLPEGNPAVPEIVLCGPCGVGKSTLVRALLKRESPAYKSRARSCRDGINYYLVGSSFYLVDTPGIGGKFVPWSYVLQFSCLVFNLVNCRPNLRHVYYCMTLTKDNNISVRDMDTILFLSQDVPNFTIVITQCDRKFTDPTEAVWRLRLKGIEQPIIACSGKDLGGVDTLRFDMVQHCVSTLPTENLSQLSFRRMSFRLLTVSQLSLVRPVFVTPQHNDQQRLDWDLEKADASSEGTAALMPYLPPSALDVRRATYKLTDKKYSEFIRKTSPWRNPLLWPSYVQPLSGLRRNIVRCPEDPTNPYLEQPRLVSHRADYVWRRREGRFSSSLRKSKKSVRALGGYFQENPNRFMAKYSIPYYPDIVPISVRPSPFTFVGSTPVGGYFDYNNKGLCIARLTAAVRGYVDAQGVPLERSLPDLPPLKTN